MDLAHDILHLAIEPRMFTDAASLFPNIKEKIQSLQSVRRKHDKKKKKPPLY